MEKLLMEQPDIADVFEHNGHIFCAVEKGLKTELFDLTRAEMDCRVSMDGKWHYARKNGALTCFEYPPKDA